MKTKKSKTFKIVAIIFFCLIYIFIAIKPLATEYQFIPQWKIQTSNQPVIKDSTDAEKLCFKLGQTMGYFDKDGNLYNFTSFPSKASISKDFYTYYSFNNKSTKIFTNDSKEKFTLNIQGFPYINDDKIFVFLPGGASISFIDNNTGKEKWNYSGSAPITAFSTTKNNCIIGFADGTINQFDFDGNLIQSFTPGGSDYSVILGAGVSNSGEYAATISGQNKQRFVLTKKENFQTKIIFHEFIDSSLARQQLVKFNNTDEYVYYTHQNCFTIVDIKKEKSHHINVKGHTISIKESDTCVYLLTKEQNKYHVYAIEKPFTLMGKFNFEAESAFIEVQDNYLYVGKDSSISKLLVTRE